MDTPRVWIPWLAFMAATANAATIPVDNNKDEEPPEVRYAAMLEAEYGPLGKTTDEILGREKTHEPVTIVGALVHRIRAKPPERMTVIEKRLLAVADLREEVNNGGFAQYFSSAAGNQAALALQALRDMGAAQMAKAMQRAMAVFPGGRPSSVLEARQKAMVMVRRRAEAAWGACDDEFYLRDEGYGELALAYAKKYRAQIILP